MITEETETPTGPCSACGAPITEEQWAAAEAGLLGIQHGVCPSSDEQSAIDAIVEWNRAREAVTRAYNMPRRGRLAGDTAAARDRLAKAEKALVAIAERH